MTRLCSARDAAAKLCITTATRPAADERVSVKAKADCERQTKTNRFKNTAEEKEGYTSHTQVV